MKRTLLAAAILPIVTVACGSGKNHSTMNMEGSTGTTGATAAPTRTVDIDMVDIAYEPKTVSVQRGERIEFVFHNKGKIAHDAFIGDTAAQADHEKEMREAKEDSMTGGHGMGDGAKAITVDAGQTGQLAYTFDRPGTIEIGCHQPGHYAAGMKVALTVT
jgi:uncharacterized cupredoxin-like copper-binding protein